MSEFPKEAREYFAEQGAIGGKKSKRKLPKKEARRIALIRWAKQQPSK